MKWRALGRFLVLVALGIGTVGAGWQLPAPPPPTAESGISLSPAEIEIYQHAKTLIDWTPHQIRDCPVLHKLQPAESQDQLPKVLERAGQIENALIRDIPQVTCLEEVTTESFKLSVKDTYHRKFQYIVIPHPDDIVPTFEEYRTDLKGNPVDQASLRHLPLITSDFVSIALVLSPADQQDNRYRYFGIQTIRDRECHVVGFAQNPERAHRPNTFHSPNKSGVLLLQGLAWIDCQTSQVLRVVIWLLAPRPDLGLRGETSTVEFYPTTPSESDKVLWLPRDVTVVVAWGGRVARNLHHYSNFKLFRVESAIKP